MGSAQIMSVGGKFKQNTRNNSIDSNTSHELNRGDVTWAEHQNSPQHSQNYLSRNLIDGTNHKNQMRNEEE